MYQITDQEVRDACLKAGIQQIDHHACSFCHYMTNYYIENESLFFDPGCDCTYGGPGLKPVPWQDAADWINVQQDEAVRLRLMKRFGFDVPENTSDARESDRSGTPQAGNPAEEYSG